MKTKFPPSAKEKVRRWQDLLQAAEETRDLLEVLLGLGDELRRPAEDEDEATQG
jgi:hypothetical protein